jgi:hypothetical protein
MPASATASEDLAEQAYVFGLPLMLMEATRRQALSLNAMRAGGPPQANRFHHARKLLTASSRTVVRPNNDTLYSSAWLDLSQGPVRLRVPPIRERYWILPLMDAWTNVFASVGSRTHGTEVAAGGGDWWIVGPAHRGPLPDDGPRLVSPTDMVWIIGRFELRGSADLAAVHALQDGLRLEPAVAARDVPAHPEPTIPPVTVTAMPAAAYFESLSALLAQVPRVPSDPRADALLQALGLVGPDALRVRQGDAATAAVLEAGKRRALARLRAPGVAPSRRDAPRAPGAWALADRPTIGRFGTDYDTRAEVALGGLGALPLEEAWYPATAVDSQDRPLDGTHRYRLHFDAGRWPPAQAFWSVTLYDEGGYFVANPIGRYAITDRDALHRNDDGSLDLWIGPDEPADPSRAHNWLPAPRGPFNLSLRIYVPTAEALAGGWAPPPVVRL